MNKRKKYEKCFRVSTKVRCQNKNEAKTNNEIIVEIQKKILKKKID